MNTYKVSCYPPNATVPPQTWTVSAEYWEYDTEFVHFFTDDVTVDAAKVARRVTVFAVPMALLPVIEMTAP